MCNTEKVHNVCTVCATKKGDGVEKKMCGNGKHAYALVKSVYRYGGSIWNGGIDYLCISQLRGNRVPIRTIWHKLIDFGKGAIYARVVFFHALFLLTEIDIFVPY